jgi:hypothetical protein
LTVSNVPAYRLLAEFEKLFLGGIYRHRSSTQGDRLALELYEDLYVRAHQRSPLSKFVKGVDAATRVVNPRNLNYGTTARRADGTLGEILHGAPAVAEPGFVVQRGTTVITEVGIEVKILTKAMVKQIDRVCGDLTKQVSHFGEKGGSKPPIPIAIVGVNHSSAFLGYEGARTTLADGTRQPDGTVHASPLIEAGRARADLNTKARPHYFQFLLLDFEATNMPPYPFRWVDKAKTTSDYNALLSKVAYEYEARF